MGNPANIIEALEYEDINAFLIASLFIMFLLNVLILCGIIFQIFIHINIFHTWRKNKTIIIILLLFEVTCNIIHANFYYMNSLYLIDIYTRQVVFLALIYYFIRKSLKINDSSMALYSKRKMALIFTTLAALIYTIIILYGIFSHTKIPICRENYWLAIRVLGVVLTMLFIFLGYQLISTYFKNMKTIYQEFWGLLFKESQAPNSISNNLIEKQTLNLLKNDENIYNLCKIIGYHLASAFLATFLTIYYSFYMNNKEDCVSYGVVFQNPITENLYFNIVLAWLINLINYYLPLIIILHVFWIKRNKKSASSFLISISDEHKFYNNFGFKKSLRNEEEEKSSGDHAAGDDKNNDISDEIQQK